MEHIPDNYEFGYPNSRYNKDKEVICPICGKICDTIYYSEWHKEVVGCDNCIKEEE